MFIKDNKIYVFGGNEHGESGIGNNKYITKIEQLNFGVTKSEIIKIACGNCFTIFLTSLLLYYN